MSFGFGFALPAYPLRGGGGNNPFNQSGPTLDLSFMGNAGNLSGADTYTLDTNFITPQYQVAAQYAVWVDGSGMTQRNFADIVTFTRASTATYFNSAGTLTTAAIDAPRFDYNPSTLAARGLLIEEQRTNLLTYSEAFDTVSDWTPTRTSVTANAASAPDGNTTADALVIDTTPLTNHSIGQNESVTSGTTYTLSVFAKANQITQINLRFNAQFPAGNTFFDLSAGTLANNGTVVASSITPVGNGWYRCTFTQTANATGTAAAQIFLAVANAVTIATANGTDNVLLWGAQLEAGAFPTSYIPTTTTALTRSADVASVNTLSPWFNATEGTIFVEASPQASNVLTFNLIDFNNTTTSNRISLSKVITSGNASLFVNDAASAQCNISSAAWTATGKLAGAYKADDFATSYNGATPATDTTGTVPSITRMQIGVRADGNNQLTGYLRRITYYPRRLANADLQTITT